MVLNTSSKHLDYDPRQKASIPDVKFVKTGISNGEPPKFLLSPLLIKRDLEKKGPFPLFFHTVQWKAKDLASKDNETDKRPVLRVVPKDLENNNGTKNQIDIDDTSPSQRPVPKLKIIVDKEKPAPIISQKNEKEEAETKDFLLTILKQLEENSKRPFPAPQPMPTPFYQVPIYVTPPQPAPLYQAPTYVTPPPRDNPPQKPIVVPTKPVEIQSQSKRNTLSQIFLKELNNAMKKMSIAGLILGILILGGLFFFIGVLASYSSLKDQKPECPTCPTPPAFADTIMEEKGKKTPETKDGKGDLKSLAQGAVDEKLKTVLPKGPAGDIVGSFMGGKSSDKPGKSGPSAAQEAERLARLELSRRGISETTIINSLPPSIRPFAQQAALLQRPGIPALPPQAAQLQGPFVKSKFGTTPPPAPRDPNYVERGYGRGTLQDAYRQRFGASSGIRPHVPKPVFAPSSRDTRMAGPAEPNIRYDAYGNPLPSGTQMPVAQQTYGNAGYPGGVPTANRATQPFQQEIGTASQMTAPQINNPQMGPQMPVQQGLPASQGYAQQYYGAPVPPQQPQYAQQPGIPQGYPGADQGGYPSPYPDAYQGYPTYPGNYYGAPQPQQNPNQQPPTRLIGMG